MATIIVECAGEDPFEFQLTDEDLALWKAIAAARGQTLDESFEQILRDFIADHPIIAQTRTPQ